MQLTYLDNAASEPLRPKVLDAMADAARSVAGLGLNPSSAHTAGRRAAALLETARAQVARALGAEPAEVIFTGGGTDSCALALRGLARAARLQDSSRTQVVISQVEHDAVRLNARDLAADGFELKVLPVTSQGVVDLEDVRSLNPATVAVLSVMSVCNENGIIQPLRDICQIVREKERKYVPENAAVLPEISLPGNTSRKSTDKSRIAIHTDAIAAAGRQEINFADSSVDAISLACHKVGGPASLGILLARRRHQQLREKLLQGALAIPGVKLTSDAPAVPGIVQFVLQGAEAEGLLFALDQAGICASAGSACHTGVARPSPVLLAQGYSEKDALGSLRISFGWSTCQEDIDRFLQALPQALSASRKLAERERK